MKFLDRLLVSCVGFFAGLVVHDIFALGSLDTFRLGTLAVRVPVVCTEEGVEYKTVVLRSRAIRQDIGSYHYEMRPEIAVNIIKDRNYSVDCFVAEPLRLKDKDGFESTYGAVPQDQVVLVGWPTNLGNGEGPLLPAQDLKVAPWWMKLWVQSRFIF